MFVYARLIADVARFGRLLAGLYEKWGTRSRERARMAGKAAMAALRMRKRADAIDDDTQRMSDAVLDDWLSQHSEPSDLRVRVGADDPGSAGGRADEADKDRDREP